MVMNSHPLPLSSRRFRYVWRRLKSLRAEWEGQFDRALQLLDEAGKIMPLRASDRVGRAMLLLKAQRISEAHVAFAALRDEFHGSESATSRYLRHFCTYQLSLLTRSSGQWSYEAKQAKGVDCSVSLKRRFPMTTTDEIWEDFQPRR